MKVIKNILLILIVFIFASTTSAYCKIVKKQIQVQTKDSRIIKATITYNKAADAKKYPTVILLHSLGYSSEYWRDLIPNLNNAGYAVIAIDFRGHGKSIYDGNFHQKTWPYFTTKTYKKFPSDVMAILDEAQKTTKSISLNKTAIIGADIGANTAVLVAKQLKYKPKTMVLISPTTTFKGLYISIAMTQIGQIPILSMVSKKDSYCLQQQKELSKFAQGGFYALNYPNGGMGMLMLGVNPTMTKDITRWVVKYLK